MAIQHPSNRPSRRALLAGAIGGFGAWAVSALGRGSPTIAANGETVTVGNSFNATLPTSITNSAGDAIQAVNSSTGASGLFGHATAATGTTYGVFGRSNSNTGIGVAGVNYAVSGDTVGVHGESAAEGGIGVRGKVTALSASGIGVKGESAAYGGAGIRGISNGSIVASGVWGSSTIGRGVVGSADSGNGVEAVSTSGNAIACYSGATNKAGVRSHSGGGSTALQGFSGTNFPGTPSKTGVYGSASLGASSKGVWGYSPAGHGLHGQSSTGWAGYFDGRVLANKYLELRETGTPAAPAANAARLFIRDNGSGKTQLCVRFHTGAVRVLATQP
jgi:hypothetical protein